MEISDCVKVILEKIGEDPNRGGLVETPYRVEKAYKELFSGYAKNAEDILKCFDDGGEGYDEFVILKDIEFVSFCVVGSTFVETPNGRIPIQYLNEGDYVYSFNEKTRDFEVEKCINPRITQKNADLIRVYTDKDSVLCTENHKFLTFNKGWVEAKNLELMDSIISLQRSIGIGPIRKNGKKYGINIIRHVDDKRLNVNESRVVHKSITGIDVKGLIVHHKDEDSTNNDPSNLLSMYINEHTRYHALKDRRGLREVERKKNMTKEEYEQYEKLRKEGIQKVLNDPIRKQVMVEKRRESLNKYWQEIRNNEEAYKERTKNMKGAKKRKKNKTNHKVIKIVSVPWKEDVWCMEVPKNKNFIANGMVVHNCEHHMLPFYGIASIGYLPGNKIVGISKLARLLDMFAKRLQVQERLTTQITEAIDWHVPNCRGAGCVIKSKHMCIGCRGVGKQNCVMVTSSLTGRLRNDPATRAEFLNLIG